MTKSAVNAKRTAKTEAEIRDSLPEILSPTVDIIFKILFGDERNKYILADFLSAVLGFKVKTRDITLLDPHLPRDRPDDKLGILDIKLRLANGEFINIEMQVENLKNIRHRVEYYISNMLTRQLNASGKYQQLAPVIAIIIAKEAMLPETERFHCEFGTLEKTEHFELHGLRTIHILELSKLPKNIRGKLEYWLKFINSEKREEYMAIAQKSKPMKQAMKVLEQASADQRLRDEYVYRIMAALDQKAKIEYWIDEAAAKGKAEGLLQGKAEGLLQGKAEGLLQGEMAKALEIAKKLRNMGFDVETTAKMTDLAVDEILSL